MRPSDVVEAAARADLAAIALTDHDTIDGIDEAVGAGTRLNVRVIAGCELSAHDGPSEVHMLALHIADQDALRPSLETFQRDRIERANLIVERLLALGLELSAEEVIAEAAGGALGRPHVARVLIRRGHVVDFREAFDRFLADGRPAYVPKPRLEIEDAIGLAHSAGALAIWAHPGRDGTRERIERLTALGLDGVEVLHPGHSPADTARLRRIAAELDLVASGGSDWHGATDGYRALGVMRVPEDWLDRQDVRIATRVA